MPRNPNAPKRPKRTAEQTAQIKEYLALNEARRAKGQRRYRMREIAAMVGVTRNQVAAYIRDNIGRKRERGAGHWIKSPAQSRIVSPPNALPWATKERLMAGR